jgi:hypothetical protein
MSISAMKQAFSALREMRHALSRAHDTMRRPTKYVSDAMTKSESAIKALQQAIAEAEKQPVHASDISQERVDETAKDRHEPYNPMERNADYERGFIGGRADQMKSSVDKAVNRMAQREWVGLTNEEIVGFIAFDGSSLADFIRAIEAKLKEKNHGNT